MKPDQVLDELVAEASKPATRGENVLTALFCLILFSSIFYAFKRAATGESQQTKAPQGVDRAAWIVDDPTLPADWQAGHNRWCTHCGIGHDCPDYDPDSLVR